MIHYKDIPDGLNAEQLRPHVKQALEIASTVSGYEDIVDVLERFYELSLSYANAYESPEPDLEDRISRYLLDHRNYDDPQIMELIFASALIFPLPQVRECITGEAHNIRNAEVLHQMKRFWNEE